MDHTVTCALGASQETIRSLTVAAAVVVRRLLRPCDQAAQIMTK